MATNRQGKRQRLYRHQDYRTPYEKLTSLQGWKKYLKGGITEPMLQREAKRMGHTEAVRRMPEAKLALLARCRQSR